MSDQQPTELDGKLHIVTKHLPDGSCNYALWLECPDGTSTVLMMADTLSPIILPGEEGSSQEEIRDAVAEQLERIRAEREAYEQGRREGQEPFNGLLP